MFVAIDIGALMPMAAYYERMDTLTEALQECEGVMLPGEARWRAHDEAQAAGGATLDGPTTTELTKLADRYGIETPWEHSLITQVESTRQ